MSAEASVSPHGQLQIDQSAFFDAGKRSPLPGLLSQIEPHRLRPDLNRGQENPIHRNAVALSEFFREPLARDREPARSVTLRDPNNSPDFFDNASEHGDYPSTQHSAL